MIGKPLVWGPASVGLWIGTASATTYGTFSLDDLNDSIGMSFVCTKAGVISKVGFYIGSITGTPPAYNAALVNLDGSGNPTQTAAGGSSIESFTPVATGWLWVTLTTPATVTLGQTVAVHVWPGVTAPDASNDMEIANIIFVQISSILVRSFQVAWGHAPGVGLFAVEYDDGVIHGIASDNVAGYYIDAADTPDEVGNRFTLPYDAVCSGCRLGFSFITGGASYEVRLYDAADTLLRSVVIADVDLYDLEGIFDFFWSPISLTADTVYRLTAKATHASSRIKLGAIGFISSTARQNALPYSDRHVMTQRADEGAWTDTEASMAYTGLLLDSVTAEAGGGGGGGAGLAYGFVG